MDTIIYYILVTLAVLITLTIHEYSHGYAAYKLGDNTAKNLGRLTLNPIAHIDPVGALCMLFFRFGWAKPVPVNMRNLKNPRRGFAIVALAGPLSNLITAFVSAFIYLLSYSLLVKVEYNSEFALALAQNTLDFIFIFHSVNIGIAIFNLIPVPPLDGSRILGLILPPRAYFKIMSHERTIYYVLIGWLLLGGYAARFITSLPVIGATPAVSVLAKILSLSDLLGELMSLISELIFKLFELIPAFKV